MQIGEAMPDEVNPQVVESVNLSNHMVLGQAVAQSHGVTLQSSACAFSILMLNAVTTQNSSAQIANAAVVTTCAEILKAGATVSSPSEPNHQNPDRTAEAEV
jgi:hypothetical protein